MKGSIIRVRGEANLKLKADLTILSLKLESQNEKYEETMKRASQAASLMEKAVEAAGFNKGDLKTSNFEVRSEYESYNDGKNNFLRRFKGYVCQQDFKLEFDFDSELLGKLLTEITRTSVDPEISIAFSVKDKEAVNEQLLLEASRVAKRKAEILAKASGKELGDLLRIDYNWDEVRLHSPTRFEVGSRNMLAAASFAPDISPEDISVRDTVLYVWKLER